MRYEVLLVDDEIMVTNSLKRLLRGEFAAIHEAHSGAEALDLLKRYPIDLVISDFCMPRMNGGELVSEIHKRYPQIVNVILSGQTPMDGFSQALNEGAISKFFCKPWNNEEFKRHIRNTIQLHEQQQLHDKVTGLPTLKLFSEKVKHLIQQDRSTACVVLINIVDFSRMIKNIGSQVTNQVLFLTAQKIVTTFPNKIIARIADDHFVIVLENEADINQDTILLHDVIEKPIQIEAREIGIKCTLGITALKNWTNNIDKNIRKNILQLRKLATTQNPIIFCSHDDKDVGLDNATLINELRHAIKNNELTLYYQPQLNAKNLCVTGCEALLRWHHPERGLIRPDEFIPLVERYGMVNDLTVMLLDQALSFMSAESTLFENISVSINLYASQIGDPELSQLVLNKLKYFGVDPNRLELEITETSLISSYEDARKQLIKLRRAGIKIAIDDFGTGFATYECLCELPLDTIKIDGCFIKNIPHHPESIAALNAMVLTAKTLDLEIIAECVESYEQVKELTKVGFNKFQGYWFSEPLNQQDFIVYASLYNTINSDVQ